MAEAPFREETPKHTVQFFREYGVYEAPDSYIVSVPNWDMAMKEVNSRDFGNKTALLPELITIAGKELRGIASYKDLVKEALEDFAQISRSKPGTTFIVGSPHFADSDQPPFNAAFVIRDGEVVDIFHKRMNASETPYLVMDPEAPPAKVNGASLLICKDFMGASFEDDQHSKSLLLSQSNRVTMEIADRLATARYTDQSLDTLYVISCWGIGKRLKGGTPQTEDQLNAYYERSLGTVIGFAFRANPNLKQIVMSDRVPSSSRLRTSDAATKPLSFIATRN